jgi:hypothetical protein
LSGRDNVRLAIPRGLTAIASLLVVILLFVIFALAPRFSEVAIK